MAKLNGQKNYAQQKAIEYPFRGNTGQSARRSGLKLGLESRRLKIAEKVDFSYTKAAR